MDAAPVPAAQAAPDAGDAVAGLVHIRVVKANLAQHIVKQHQRLAVCLQDLAQLVERIATFAQQLGT